MIRVESMGIGHLLNPGLARTLRTLICAAITGVVIVIAPAPINLIVLFGWIYLLRRSTRTRRGLEPAKASSPARGELDWVPATAKLGFIRPRTVVAIHVAVVSTIIAVAGCLPVKEIDRCLNREITLPKTTMTLGEFAELRPNSHAHPLHFSLEPVDEKVVIHFPRNRMRLGEIITAIEDQSRFRRRIAKCANESTVLWGSCVMYIAMQPAYPPGHRDPNRVLARASAGEGAGRPPQGSIEQSVQPPSTRERLDTKHAEAPLESAR